MNRNNKPSLTTASKRALLPRITCFGFNSSHHQVYQTKPILKAATTDPLLKLNGVNTLYNQCHNID
jgi:hypothetical protein